jgi:hypothetical protein
MFLRIFRYRVQAELRDRHLALQARASRLYQRYVTNPVGYFRRAADPSIWVELHHYVDREECQKVAIEVAADPELARLWKDFQETLDPSYPPTLEEFTEYELPVSINASPFAQPPIDVRPATNAPTAAAAAATVAASSEVLEPAAPATEVAPAAAAPADAAADVAPPPKLKAEPASAAPIASPAHDLERATEPHIAVVHDHSVTVIEPPQPHLVESPGDETPSSPEIDRTIVRTQTGYADKQQDDGGLTIYEEPADEQDSVNDSASPVPPADDELAPATTQRDDSADIWVDRAEDVERTVEGDSDGLTIEQGPPEDEPSTSDDRAHPTSREEHVHPYEEHGQHHEQHGHGEPEHPEHGNGEHRQHGAEHDAPPARPLSFNDGVWQVEPPREN